MYCQKCGKELKDTDAFCTACGTPRTMQVQTPVATSTPTGQKASKKKFMIPVVVVLLLVIAGIAASSLLGDEGKDTEVVQTAESTEVVETDEEVVTEAVSYDELLGNLEQAKTTIDDMMSQYSNINLEDTNESLKQHVAILKQLQQNLNVLQEEAASLELADDKLEEAVDAYYCMASSFVNAYYDVLDFLYRFINNESFVMSRPDINDPNKSEQEIYDAMIAWLDAAQSEYASFEYPSFVEAYWKEYEEFVDLNQTIIDKYAIAVSYSDPLTFKSCIELYERVKVAEDKWYEAVIDSSGGMTNSFAKRNCGLADDLYDEIQTYTAMSEQKKEEYVFANNKTGTIYYKAECVDTIYPSLYTTYDSFAIIDLATYGGQEKIVLEVEIPGFTQQYRQSYTVTTTPKQIFIKPPLLAGELDLTSAKSAQMSITVYGEDGNVRGTNTYPVTIKSKNDVEWHTDDFGVFTKDNILCFLTPESSGISSLKRSAIDEMSVITNNKVESLPGYQLVAYNNYTMTYLQATALMRAMYNDGVRYSMDPFSVSGSHQHILLPDQVLENKQGLCIETSLTIASALQSAGMHAFLIFPENHAQVAVEVWNEGEGYGEYFLIETTALSEVINGNAYIDYANELNRGNLGAAPQGCIRYFDVKGWASYLNEVEYVIDCNDSRILGMTPFSN